MGPKIVGNYDFAPSSVIWTWFWGVEKMFYLDVMLRGFLNVVMLNVMLSQIMRWYQMLGVIMLCDDVMLDVIMWLRTRLCEHDVMLARNYVISWRNVERNYDVTWRNVECHNMIMCSNVVRCDDNVSNVVMLVRDNVILCHDVVMFARDNVWCVMMMLRNNVTRGDYVPCFKS